MNTAPTIIVMGVSGSGKSHIGAALAARLGLTFFDADDYHGPANIEKMTNGIPLTDADRQTWLDDLATLLRQHHGVVLACSALKIAYRARLRQAAPQAQFLFLNGDFDLIWSRLTARQGHFFSGQDLLRDQFKQLEVPDATEAVAIDIAQSPDHVLSQCVSAVGEF